MPPLKTRQNSQTTSINPTRYNEDITNLHFDIKSLDKQIKLLQKQIDDGHFCKWNGTIGGLNQWKTDSNANFKYIYNSLDKQKNTIEKHDKILGEIESNKKLMTSIEKNQVEQANLLRHNRLWIFLVLLSCLISLFGKDIVSFLSHLP